MVVSNWVGSYLLFQRGLHSSDIYIIKTYYSNKFWDKYFFSVLQCNLWLYKMSNSMLYIFELYLIVNVHISGMFMIFTMSSM